MRAWAASAFVFFSLSVPLWAATSAPDYSPPTGAINPQVTQANIAQTICVLGWPRSIRPPAEYTNALKRRQIAERHLPGRPSDYEEDHLIPLNLGGHPTSPDNLWPQPIRQAQVKDKLEYALNRAVCAGRMTLAAAQLKIKGSSGKSGKALQVHAIRLKALPEAHFSESSPR